MNVELMLTLLLTGEGADERPIPTWLNAQPDEGLTVNA